MFLRSISRRQSYHSTRDALKRMQSRPKESIFDTIKGAQNDLGKPIAARVSFSQDFKVLVHEVQALNYEEKALLFKVLHDCQDKTKPIILCL